LPCVFYRLADSLTEKWWNWKEKRKH